MTGPDEVAPLTTPARRAASRSGPRGRRRLCWLLAFLWLMGSHPRPLSETVRVIDPPSVGVLAIQDPWIAPLAQSEWIQRLAEWPYWVYSAAAALLIALTCTSVMKSSPLWLRLVLLVAFSATLEPRHLLPALLLMMIIVPFHKNRSRIDSTHFAAPPLSSVTSDRTFMSRVELFLLLAAVGLGLLLTVEFGLILLVGLLLCVERLRAWSAVPWKHRVRLAAIGFGSLVLVVGVVAAFAEGFLPMLLRPFSGLWIMPPAGLLPTLNSPLRPELFSALRFLMLVPFALCWGELLLRPGNDRSPHHLLPLSVLTLIGLGTARFLWPSSFAAVLMTRPGVAWRDGVWLNRLAVAGCILLATARLSADSGNYRDFVWKGKVPPRAVDPTQWKTSGRVMLMNLDQSADWQSAELIRMFPLLVDDRWDVFSGKYLEYAATCRDIAEVRSDAYLREDGKFGGYLLRLNDWEPVLLVVDSADLESIRSLSLSPHWALMGMDSQRTIFGRSHERRNIPQLRQASRILLQLEWPGAAGALELTDVTDVLVAENDAARRRVADVVRALRLPYAALRILPADENWASERIRIWCYLELAHRHSRYSGRLSLLDQFRALARVRQAAEHGRWSQTEKKRLSRSLEGLGVASATIESILESTAEHRPDSVEEDASLDAEGRLRRAMAAGDLMASRQFLSDVPEPTRPFYEALLASVEQEPGETMRSLEQSLNSPGFPPSLRGEALFYLGGVAIEAGHSLVAFEALQESARQEPSSAFDPLRRMYLRQLSGVAAGRPGR